MRILKNQIPGFAGIIGGKDPVKDVRVVGGMMARIMYGGRSKAGGFGDGKSGIWLEWTDHGSSPAINLPVWNKEKNIGLFFWGEIFSDESKTQDRHLREFLTLYEREGIKGIRRLNGWFAGMFIDLRNRQAVLFNDRYGLFRIHYHQTRDGFYFSSEAKAILGAIPDTRTLDPKSLAEFISCSGILQNRTMFSGISTMPGGSAWKFMGSQSVRKEAYFHKEELESQEPLDAREYYEELKETWVKILARYMAGSENLGMSLTGGVDSRMIIAGAPCPAGSLKCYTFGGMYRDSVDVLVGRKVAEICQQPHESIYVGRDFLTNFTELATESVYISDGTVDASGSIDLYIQRMAQQIAPIRVTGTSGGELLRSLVAFKPARLHMDIFSSEFRSVIQAAARTYAYELGSEHRLSFTAFKQTPWYMNSKFIVERSQVALRMPYLDNDFVSLVYRAPRDLPVNNGLALQLIADMNPTLAGVDTDQGINFKAIPGLTQFKPILQKFTFKLEYAFDYGMPSWLSKLDRYFSALHFEKKILGRHKFHHFRIWYKNELSNVVKEILLDHRTLRRSYLNGAAIEKMIADHIKGTGNYTREIHKLLAVELLQRMLLDSPESSLNE
jgi:asparagine synthase (glutamine-hydrolysing)